MRGEGDAGKRGEKVRLKRNEDPEEGENRRQGDEEHSSRRIVNRGVRKDSRWGEGAGERAV